MARNVTQLVQALDALNERVTAAATGANDEGLKMSMALVTMVKISIMFNEQQAAARQQQQHQQMQQQLQMLETRLASEFTTVNGRIQSATEGTLNAVMQALVQHRTEGNSNGKKELPILENKSIVESKGFGK